MKTRPALVTLALLFPTTNYAASISMDDSGAFGQVSPTEILNEHRNNQYRKNFMGLPGEIGQKTLQSNIWDLDYKDSQAYDWFQATNVLSPELESNLASIGTPVPEPSGTLLFGLAGLALSIRRQR